MSDLIFDSGNIEFLYCFHCKSMPENIPQSAGWNFFDLQAEYQRMQVPNDEWCLTLLNKDYEVIIICATKSWSIRIDGNSRLFFTAL